MKESCFINCGQDCVKIVIIILLYSGLLRLFISTKTEDPLVKLRSPYCGNFLNGWTGTHFLFFSYLGYRYPNCFEEAMFFGILWELLEFSVGELLPFFAPDLASKIDPFWMSWYYGCYEDIIANAVGFQVGSFLKKLKIKKSAETQSVPANNK